MLPTLLHLAGSSQEKNNQKLDGLDQWSALTGHSRPPRKIMVYNIDDNLVPAVLNGPNMQPQFQIAVRENNFKLIWGQQKMLHRYKNKEDRDALFEYHRAVVPFLLNS